jgi:prevent-host-death family protein
VKSAKINIHEAKTHLSRLVEDVAAGSEVLIAKGGKAMARLVPLRRDDTPRRPGLLKGKLRIADDFERPWIDGAAALT